MLTVYHVSLNVLISNALSEKWSQLTDRLIQTFIKFYQISMTQNINHNMYIFLCQRKEIMTLNAIMDFI